VIEAQDGTPAQRRSHDKLDEPAERPRLLTIDAACRYSGVSRTTLYKSWIPRLRTLHIGKKHLIDRASLDALIDELFAAE